MINEYACFVWAIDILMYDINNEYKEWVVEIMFYVVIQAGC